MSNNKLRKDWSIACDDSKFMAYKETLKALGYDCYKYSDECVTSLGYVYFCENYNCFARSYSPETKNNFNNIESFLLWHFKQESEETEQQKQIRELKETIDKAQKQIEELQGSK